MYRSWQASLSALFLSVVLPLVSPVLYAQSCTGCTSVITPSFSSTAAVYDTAVLENGGSAVAVTFYIKSVYNYSGTVSYTVSGSAVETTDYTLSTPFSVAGTQAFSGGSTAMTVVIPVDNSLKEGNRTLSVTFTGVTGSLVTLGAVNTRTATLTIIDDETPLFSIAAADNTASETGSDPGVYTVYSSGNLAEAVSVDLTTTGTSIIGSDYNLSVGSSLGEVIHTTAADFSAGDLADNVAVGDLIGSTVSGVATDSIGLAPATLVYGNPPSNTTLTGAQALPGTGSFSSSSFVIARPGGGYRLYYDSGTSNRSLVYRDTTGNEIPNNTNLGVAVALGVGGSSSNIAANPVVVPLPGGGYRLYYGNYNGSRYQIAFRDTTDGNLPAATNLTAQSVLISGSSWNYTPYIYRLPSGHYRIYYGFYFSSYWRLRYRDTTDLNPPNVSNLSSEVSIDSIVHNGVAVAPLSSGGYRLYYSSGRQLYYRDTTDNNPPASSNLGAALSLGVATSIYNDGVHVIPLDTPSGAYRLIYPGDASNLHYRDSTKLATYFTSGSYTSSVMDMGAAYTLGLLNYTTTEPAGTSLTVDVRAGNSSVIDGTWTSWQSNIASGGDISALGTHRYFQYKVWFNTTDTAVTPLLHDVTLTYNAGTATISGPVAGPSSLTHTSGSDFSTGSLDMGASVLVDAVQLASAGGVTATDSGLVGLWGMNNSWVDSSPTAKSFSAIGAVFTTDAKSGSHAGNFDGVNDYVRFHGFSDLGTQNAPYTIEGWLKAPSSETDGNIIHMSSGSTGASWCLPPVTLVGGKLRVSSWSIVPSALVSATGVTSVNDGNWHHFATTWDPANGLRLFVDGVLDASTPQATYSASGANNYLWLSMHNSSCTGSNGYFNGQLDDVAVFNRALTDVEIAARATYSLSGTYTSTAVDLGAASLGVTTVDYTKTIPSASTALEIDVRAADTADFLTNTTGWMTNVSNGANLSAGLGSRRYIQYRVRMSTTDTTLTPRLEDITFNYSGYPSTMPVRLTVPVGSLKTTIVLTPIDDVADEYDETATLTVIDGLGYYPNSFLPVSATVTIADNDVNEVNVVAISDGAEQGGVAGSFTVSRTGILNASLTVFYTVSGTAAGGSDYIALSGSVTLPPGSGISTNGASVSFTPLNDSLIEGAETIIVTISANASYRVGATNVATASIIDNDTDGSSRADTSGTFTQTNWASTAPTTSVDCTSFGGTWTGSACIGIHGGNRTNWSTFSAVGSVVDAVGTPGQIMQIPKFQAWTQTDNGYSDSGFWSAGYEMSGFTTVTGFGLGADLTLAPIEVGDGSDGAFDSDTYNGSSIAGITGVAPTFTINTDEVTRQGVYNFTDFNLSAGHTLTVTGSNPLRLYVVIDTKINGVMNVWAAGGSGGTQTLVTGGAQGLPGMGVGPNALGGGDAAGKNDRPDADPPVILSVYAHLNGGGGGGHALPGTSGSSSNTVDYPAGVGGEAYGDDAITVLYGGSGGGAAFSLGNCTGGSRASPGGSGGGAILVHSGSSISVAGSINANGVDGTTYQSYSSSGSCSSSARGSSGGGAGGAIKLVATNIILPSGATRVSAIGGAAYFRGGAGSGGRIRLEATNLQGVTPTTTNAGTGTNTTASLSSFVNAGTGTYTSRVQYMGYVNGLVASPGVWGTMTWNETVPAGSSLSVSVRSCYESDCSDRGLNDWSQPTKGQDISALTFVEDTHAYIQYKVDMSTDGIVLPRLHSITINTIDYGGAVWYQTDDSSLDTGFNKAGALLNTTLVAGNDDSAVVVLNGVAGTGVDGDFDSGTYDGSSIPGITGLKPNITIDTSHTARNGSYNFASFIVRQGDSVRVRGSNPLTLRALSDVNIDGILNGDGYDGGTSTLMGVAGPGGGNGGAGCAAGVGLGAGFGVALEQTAGAGGASYASLGTVGGDSYGVLGSNPGALYGDTTLATSEAGSGGGGGAIPSGGCANAAIGGGGGGAIRIITGGIFAVGRLGLLSADGGNGDSRLYTAIYPGGGAGGGSGGSIKVSADKIVLNNPGASLSVQGGQGGVSYFFAEGGHGGDGRIHLTSNLLQGSSSINIGDGSLVTQALLPSSPINGTYTSGVFDANYPVSWNDVYWVASTPTGSTLTAAVRSCAVASCSDRGASDWSVMANGAVLPSLSFVTDGHQYLQYRLSLSSDGRTLPLLHSIAANFRQDRGGATLTSSVYDTQDNSNKIVALTWVADTSGPGTGVEFQLRTSPDGVNWGAWMGPSSTSDYYTVSGSSINAVHADGVNDRYVQYQVKLINSVSEYTPILQEVSLQYITFGSGTVVGDRGPFGGGSGDSGGGNSGGDGAVASDSSSGGGAVELLLTTILLLGFGCRLRYVYLKTSAHRSRRTTAKAVFCVNGMTVLVLMTVTSSVYGQYVLNISAGNPLPGANYTTFSVGNINSDFYQEFSMQNGYRYYQGGSGVASGGTMVNGSDPLGFGGASVVDTGNGTGNPNKIIIWQRNRTADVLIDFLKDKFDKKPRIMQTLVDADMLGEFSIDMRGISYSNNTTEAPVINRQTFAGQSFADVVNVDWDLAKDAQIVKTNAGKYTYSNGTGDGGSSGTYVYVDGGYNPLTTNWSGFFDTTDPTNVWSNSTNKPK